MEISEIIAFIIGLTTALGLSALIRILIGIKLKLYLISIDTSQVEQSIVPITAELKKRYLLKTILSGNWKENLEITLTDYQSRSYTFQIGFHLFGRFYLRQLSGENQTASLNQETMKPNHNYYFKSGMRLETGDRAFEMLITTSPLEQVASEFT
jgi:hypothetical protein